MFERDEEDEGQLEIQDSLFTDCQTGALRMPTIHVAVILSGSHNDCFKFVECNLRIGGVHIVMICFALTW